MPILDIGDLINITSLEGLGLAERKQVAGFIFPQLIREGYNQQQSIDFLRTAFREVDIRLGTDADFRTIYNLAKSNEAAPNLYSPLEKLAITEEIPIELHNARDIAFKQNFYYVSDVLYIDPATGELRTKLYGVYSGVALTGEQVRTRTINTILEAPVTDTDFIIPIGSNIHFAERRATPL